jgi:reactive intermediate/imine deaminase
MIKETIAGGILLGVVGFGLPVLDVVPVSTQQTAEPEYLNPSARTPLSEGVRYGGIVYLSGKLGVRPERGIGPETRAALQSIKDALERHGSSMDRVLKCTVMLADMAEWGAMNEVYTEFFPENKPARSAFGASGLAAEGRVEIECMAAA